VEAWERPRRRTYLEPFHLRALALVREDADELARAAAAFQALRLDWHAERTRELAAR
jgi:hypothetical protein